MTRAALLASAAVGTVAAWTVTASAGTLWAADLWSHPFYAGNSAWAWSWWSYMARPAARADLGSSLFTGALAASLPLGLAIRFGAARALSANPLHGTTGWLNDREAKAGGFSFSRQPRPDSIVIGTRGRGLLRRYVGLPGEEHAALTAKTRSGKGVSVVVPNALNWSGSLVAFSVKRDVFDASAGHRARLGDRVFVFDLSDPQRRTHRWNPLGYVRRGAVETYGDIYRAMWFLVPETKANNPYFNDAARKLAAAVAVILAETPSARLNVAEVLNTVQRPDWPTYLGGLIEDARAAGRPYSRSATNVALWMIANAGEKEVRDVIGTLTTALALWDDPVVASATAESDFDIGELRDRRMAVFVCGGPADIRIYRPVYGLFWQQLVQRGTRVEFGRDPGHKHRVLGILDEFWALGKQDVLADASAFTASYGFRWCYVQQSEEQSVSAFGKEGAANLFTNTGARLDFGGMDREAAEKISKWAGDNTVKARSRSRPKFMAWALPAKQTESESERPRPLVLPQEIQRLDGEKLLVRRGRLHLFKLDRIAWFRDPWFRHFGWDADPARKPLGPPPPDIAPLPVAVEREDVEAVRARRQEAAERFEAAAQQQATEEHEKAEAKREAAEQKAEAKRVEAERKAVAKRAETERKAEAARRDAERKAEAEAERERQEQEGERHAAHRRLEALRAAHRDATTKAGETAGEALDAAAKASSAAEAARLARTNAKGGDEAAGAEAARLAVLAAAATEVARQAKQRASAATRDAQTAAKRLEAFTHALALV